MASPVDVGGLPNHVKYCVSVLSLQWANIRTSPVGIPYKNGKAVVTADNRKHINGRNPEIAGAVTKPSITANGQINSSRYNVLSDIDFVSENTGADNVSIEGLQPRVRDFKKGKEVYGRVDVQGNHGHQGGPRNGKALVEARVNG
jgi:hypothetical protein